MVLWRTLLVKAHGNHDSNDTLTVFTHMVCTGGTTFTDMMDNYYWQYEVLMTRDIWEFGPKSWPDTSLERRQRITEEMLSRYRRHPNRIRLVRGHHHVSYDQRQIWGPRPVEYITMLREPVARFISHSGYGTTSLEALRELEEHPSVNFNLQTTYLCGCPELCASSEANLELAKKNLAQYKLVGITERFDDSVELYTKLFGYPHVGWRQNPRVVSPRKPPIPDEVRERIRERSHMDVRLYEFAKTLLAEQLESMRAVPPREARHRDRLMYRIRQADLSRFRGVRYVRKLIQLRARPQKEPTPLTRLVY
jgi:hypothetical protein